MMMCSISVNMRHHRKHGHHGQHEHQKKNQVNKIFHRSFYNKTLMEEKMDDKMVSKSFFILLSGHV